MPICALSLPNVWPAPDLRLDFDPNVDVDESRLLYLRGWIEVLSHRSQDQALDLGCRNSIDGSSTFRLALEQGGGQIVARYLMPRLRTWLGVMRLPRSSKIRPAGNRRPDCTFPAWTVRRAVAA